MQEREAMNSGPFTELLSGFIPVTDAAKELGVNRSTLWRWIKLGKASTYRIGGAVLIERRVLEDLKAKR